ncbi:hypothetical protein [Spiroplasma litorale]|nr:hypothetical protein [Spiroplasma litorale]
MNFYSSHFDVTNMTDTSATVKAKWNASYTDEDIPVTFTFASSL